MEVQQFSIALMNVPGTLAEVTERLAKANINIRAFTVVESADYSILRMVVKDQGAAEKALRERHIPYTLTPVLLVTLPDEPGTLSKLAKVLAHARINIHYLYPLISSGPEAILVICLDELAKAREALRQNEIKVISGDEFLGAIP
jgi:hypothetical protein